MSKKKRAKYLTVQQAMAKLHKKVTFRDKGNKAFLVGTVSGVTIVQHQVIFEVNNVYGRGTNTYQLTQDQIDFI